MYTSSFPSRSDTKAIFLLSGDQSGRLLLESSRVSCTSWEPFVGPEVTGQGNDETRAVQGGGFAEWSFVPQRVSLSLHGGYKESWSPGESRRRGAYLGLALYHRF